MIVCRKCGTQNDDVSEFCRDCDAYIGWAKPDDAITAPVPFARPPVERAGSVAVDDPHDLFVGVAPSAGGRRKETEPPAAVRLTVDPVVLEVDPGGDATAEFRVLNASALVDGIDVTVEGDAADWATVAPATSNVYPGDTATGTISFHPPSDPPARAGPVRLEVRARSVKDPAVSATARVTLTVRPLREMTLDVVPVEVTGRRARHVLTVGNTGNAGLKPEIRVLEENNAVVTAVEPGYVTLPPGRSQKVDVRVRPRRRNWIGGAKSYRYRLVAHDPDTPPAELDAALTQRPLIPGWVAGLVAVAVPLLAALVAFLMLWTTVPDLEGLDEAAATERLEEAGLEAAVARQHTAEVAAGKVLRTDPEGGARIREGSKVKLFVSAGPRPVPIPNVVGLDEATARLELTGMGFVIEEVAEESAEVEPGLVVSTRPAANLLVPPGSKVEMIVAEPPAKEKGAGGEDEKKGGEEAGGEEGGGEEGSGEGAGEEDGPKPPYWTSSVASSDFDGDGDADPAVFRPSTGAWHVRPGPGENAAVDWARQRGNDIPVPGDYDGDGVADFATWRPSDATWYVRNGDSVAHEIVELGKPGDIPVPADYDGDGTTDRAIFGAEDGRWRIEPSSGDDSAVREIEWGDRAEGDLPVPADYDGDGKTDLAFYRPNTGRWNVSLSGGGREAVVWGDAEEGDIPVPGDYTGDGRADYAVWRPAQGEWRVNPSGRGANVFVTWGRRDLLDVPVPGDYTGDGTFDYVVWRESTRAWRILPAEGKRRRVHYWGREGDVPV